MGQRITFSGRGRECAVKEDFVAAVGEPPLPENKTAFSIVEPRIKYVKGWLTGGTAPPASEGKVECGPGTDYPMEVTLDQLSEIIYRVKKTRMTSVSGTLSRDESYVSSVYGDVTTSINWSYSLGSGAPPESLLSFYELGGNPFILMYGGVTGTPSAATVESVYDPETDDTISTITGWVESESSRSGRIAMDETQAEGFYGERYVVEWGYQRLAAREAQDEHSLFTYVIVDEKHIFDKACAFSMFLQGQYNPGGTPSSELTSRYGPYSSSSTTGTSTLPTPSGSTTTKSHAEQVYLFIGDYVAYTGNSPFDAGSKLYLSLFFNCNALYFNSPYGADFRSRIFTQPGSDSSPINVNAGYLILRLSRSQEVKCEIYGYTRRSDEATSFAFSATGEFIFEATEWWPYATSTGADAWDPTTGLPMNGGPGA